MKCYFFITDYLWHITEIDYLSNIHYKVWISYYLSTKLRDEITLDQT